MPSVTAYALGMRSRLLGAVVVGATAAVLAGACSDDESAEQTTLPPIVTTTMPPTTTLPPPTTQPQFYEVQPGDTLTEIAVAYGLPIPAIMQINNITNQDAIFAGQILQLPNAADIVANSLPPTPGQTTIAGATPAPASVATTTIAP